MNNELLDRLRDWLAGGTLVAHYVLQSGRFHVTVGRVVRFYSDGIAVLRVMFELNPQRIDTVPGIDKEILGSALEPFGPELLGRLYAETFLPLARFYEREVLSPAEDGDEA